MSCIFPDPDHKVKRRPWFFKSHLLGMAEVLVGMCESSETWKLSKTDACKTSGLCLSPEFHARFMPLFGVFGNLLRHQKTLSLRCDCCLFKLKIHENTVNIFMQVFRKPSLIL